MRFNGAAVNIKVLIDILKENPTNLCRPVAHKLPKFLKHGKAGLIRLLVSVLIKT
jgi:hypothetical protein